jgi:hypothetical protein
MCENLPDHVYEYAGRMDLDDREAFIQGITESGEYDQELIEGLRRIFRLVEEQ